MIASRGMDVRTDTIGSFRRESEPLSRPIRSTALLYSIQNPISCGPVATAAIRYGAAAAARPADPFASARLGHSVPAHSSISRSVVAGRSAAGEHQKAREAAYGFLHGTPSASTCSIRLRIWVSPNSAPPDLCSSRRPSVKNSTRSPRWSDASVTIGVAPPKPTGKVVGLRAHPPQAVADSSGGGWPALTHCSRPTSTSSRAIWAVANRSGSNCAARAVSMAAYRSASSTSVRRAWR